MARYTASVCHLCLHSGEKLFLKGSRCLTPKCAVDRRRRTSSRRPRRASERALQLLEKQKLRWTYGMLERQFRRFFGLAEKQAGITGENLQVLLERRLDNVIYRLGFADSRKQARQLVQHGHFLLNGRKTNIPSCLVKEGDTIGWKAGSAKTEYYKQLVETIESKTMADWLSLDRQNLTARVLSLPTPDAVGPKFDVKTIVEYYSR